MSGFGFIPFLLGAALGQVAAEPATPEPSGSTDVSQELSEAASSLGREESAAGPALRVAPEPEYPARALAERISGEVTVRLDVDAGGIVERVVVVKTATRAENPVLAPTSTSSWGFEAAAVAAAREARFTPFVVEGAPVPFSIDYTFRFDLPERAPLLSAAALPVLRLTGVVQSAGRRTKVAGATVLIQKGEMAFEATTDEDGGFSFYDLEPGTWTLLVEAAGHAPLTSEETLDDEGVLELRYTLIPDPSEAGYDVIVEADRAQREVTRRHLGAEELIRIPGTLGDPVVAVENLPGVARTGSFMVLRGSAPQDSWTLFEGVPVLFDSHFGGLRSVIAAPLLERVDLYPGNFSVRYGRRTGGVLEVGLRSLETDQLHGELELSVLDAGLYLEAPIGEHLAVAVSGRRSHVDLFLDALVGDEDLRLVSAPRYYDYQALASWHPSREHDIDLFVLGSDDRSELLFSDATSQTALATGSSVRTANAFQRVIARHRARPSAEVENELLIAYGQDQIDNQAFGDLRLIATIDHALLREELTLRPRRDLSIAGGLDVHYQGYRVEAFLPRPPLEGQPPAASEPVFAEGRVDDLQAGAYLEAQWNLFEGLTLIPGLRADYFSVVNASSFDPRLTVRYGPHELVTLKAGVGLFHQMPQVQELEPPFGNPGLGLISATHYSVGVEYFPIPALRTDLTLFYKDIGNLPSPSEAVDLVDGERRLRVFDQEGRGRVIGAELWVELARSGGFEGWLAYTLSRAERTDAPGGEARLFDFDQTHNLVVVGTYHFGRTWSLGARWRFVTGRPTTPFSGGVWRADRDEYEPVPGALNSTRLAAFHQLDVRLDKVWYFADWLLETYVSVANAYNRANVEAVRYNYDFTETEPVSGLPLLVILGVKAAF